MSGVVVVGLVPGFFAIEDIRIVVPHRQEVRIPAHLVHRSKDLVIALQQQRVMQLGSPLPTPPAPKAIPLTIGLRGRGIAPHPPVAPRQDPWPREREGLVRELESSRAQNVQVQDFNESLQATLTSLTSQLTQIQRTLNELDLPRGGRVQSPAQQQGSQVQDESPAIDADIPHYVLPTTTEQAEVRIAIPEKTSEADLSGARGVLRSLRDKASPGKL